MRARLIPIAISALALASSFGAVTGVAEAALTKLPAGFYPEAVSGRTAYGSDQSDNLALMDLKAGKSTSLGIDFSTEPVSIGSQTAVASRFGAARIPRWREYSADGQWVTSTLTMVSRSGNVSTPAVWTDPAKNRVCDDFHRALAISDAGDVTVLNLGLAPSGHGTGCLTVNERTSLERISPSGKHRKLWLPDRFKASLLSASFTASGNVFAYAPATGRMSFVRFLDLARHRVVGTFHPPGNQGRLQVQLSNAGAALITRDSKDRKGNYLRSMYLKQRSTSRARLILPATRLGLAWIDPVLCGSRAFLARPGRDGFHLSRAQVIDSRGKTIFDHRFKGSVTIRNSGCDAKTALFNVYSDDDVRASPDDGEYMLGLASLGK